MAITKTLVPLEEGVNRTVHIFDSTKPTRTLDEVSLKTERQQQREQIERAEDCITQIDADLAIIQAEVDKE